MRVVRRRARFAQPAVTTVTAISEWADNASEQVLAALQVQTVPSESCIRRNLQRLDGDELDTAIGQWAAARTEPAAGERRVIAVDGKTMRGSGSEIADARHLLAAIDHRAGVVLAQVDVCSKTRIGNRFALRVAANDPSALQTARMTRGQQDHLIRVVRLSSDAAQFRLPALA